MLQSERFGTIQRPGKSTDFAIFETTLAKQFVVQDAPVYDRCFCVRNLSTLGGNGEEHEPSRSTQPNGSFVFHILLPRFFFTQRLGDIYIGAPNVYAGTERSNVQPNSLFFGRSFNGHFIPSHFATNISGDYSVLACWTEDFKPWLLFNVLSIARVGQRWLY